MNYEHDIKTLLTIGENIVIEFKRAGNGPEHDTYESICAFLNRQGGDFLLGALRTGNGGGYLAHAARTCAVGTGVRLSAHAEYDFRSAPAILRNRGYGSRPRG